MNETKITKIPLVDLQAQSRAIREEVLEGVAGVVDSCAFILGPQVAEFEKQFAEYCQAEHCVGLASGTEALHMALRALDIGPGDEVITAGNSFAATAFAIAYVGAKAVFVDVDPEDYNIDVSLIEQAISEKTKAIIPVHLYGQPARMNEIMDIAKRHNLRVVEDSAQGHGAEIDGKRVGSFGDINCFSFYPGKNLGAYGDGGAITTNDSELADKIRLLRNYGQKVKNRHDMLAFNCRLDTMQAAVLLVKMKYIEQWTDQRAQVAQWYREALQNVDVTLPHQHENMRHVYHLFVVRHPQRDAILAELANDNVFGGVHYPNPLVTAQPFLDSVCFPMGLPTVSKYAKEILSLPMYPEMTQAHVQMVADSLAAAVKKVADLQTA